MADLFETEVLLKFFQAQKSLRIQTVSGNLSNHIIISVYINLLMRKEGNNYK